jgi:hypothetical protein
MASKKECCCIGQTRLLIRRHVQEWRPIMFDIGEREAHQVCFQ